MLLRDTPLCTDWPYALFPGLVSQYEKAERPNASGLAMHDYKLEVNNSKVEGRNMLFLQFERYLRKISCYQDQYYLQAIVLCSVILCH